MPSRPRFGRIFRPKRKRPDGTVREIKVHWIEYYANGRQIRESSKSPRRKGTYRDAEALLLQRRVELENGTFNPAKNTNVDDLLDVLLADYEINEKSVDWARYSTAHLRDPFGSLRADSVSSTHISGYISQRRAAGIANSTINRELALLRRAYNLGRGQSPPLVKRIPSIPRLKEPRVRKGFFEHSEFVRLRGELPEYLRPVATFAYFTGMRRGEILALQWPQIDLRHRVARLNPGETKNDEPRIVPLMAELYEVLVLQEQIRDQRWPDCPWVFFGREGRRIKSYKNAWGRACKRAGFWEGETEDQAGKHTKLFHDLRRTGARNLVRAGVPERVVMEIGGWKTRSVFDRYNVVSERDLHEAAAKLEDYVGELEKGGNEATSRQLSENGESKMDQVHSKQLN